MFRPVVDQTFKPQETNSGAHVFKLREHVGLQQGIKIPQVLLELI
jgi:hypothetical protein